MIDPELKELDDKVRTAQAAANTATNTFHKVAIEKIRLIKKIDPSHIIQLGTWDCDSSPTGKCAYDLTDENLLGDDECVFCHAPDERK